MIPYRSLTNIALYKQTHMCPGARLTEFNQIGWFVIVSYDVPHKWLANIAYYSQTHMCPGARGTRGTFQLT